MPRPYGPHNGELALIWGHPLPPIPGRQLVERGGIAIPAGFDWSPPLTPRVLRELLCLSDGDLALFDEEGAWQHIPAANFVPATRSAVRLTVQGATP